MAHLVAAAPLRQFKPVRTEVDEATCVKDGIMQSSGKNCARARVCCLYRSASLGLILLLAGGWIAPFIMREREALERNARNKLPMRRLTLKSSQLPQHGGDDADRTGRFALAWHIEDRVLPGIQKPLARCVERIRHPLQVPGVPGLELKYG